MHRTINAAVATAWLGYLICSTGSPAAAESPDPADCRTIRVGELVELHSPAFVFCLNASSALRAEWWENRLTGRRITLGSGPDGT